MHISQIEGWLKIWLSLFEKNGVKKALYLEDICLPDRGLIEILAKSFWKKGAQKALYLEDICLPDRGLIEKLRRTECISEQSSGYAEASERTSQCFERVGKIRPPLLHTGRARLRAAALPHPLGAACPPHGPRRGHTPLAGCPMLWWFPDCPLPVLLSACTLQAGCTKTWQNFNTSLALFKTLK